MANCGKCGNEINEGVKFCPNCGADTSAPATNNFGAKIAGLNNTADTTAEYDSKDIEANKMMSLLAYLGPLVFIPMFAVKDSKYARFHSNQGLILLIVYVGYAIVQFILGLLLRTIFPWNWSYGYFGGRGVIYDVLTTVLGLVWIPIAILAILGIINAVSGKAKELPFIGKFKLIK